MTATAISSSQSTQSMHDVIDELIDELLGVPSGQRQELARLSELAIPDEHKEEVRAFWQRQA